MGTNLVTPYSKCQQTTMGKSRNAGLTIPQSPGKPVQICPSYQPCRWATPAFSASMTENPEMKLFSTKDLDTVR